MLQAHTEQKERKRGGLGFLMGLARSGRFGVEKDGV